MQLKLTHWVLIAVSAALIGIDIYWATNAERGDTISEVILKYARKYQVIAFLFGVLMGHLLWPQFVTP